MKCFNHEDRDAVATCQRCGKALCKECASKYTPCLCDTCFTAIQAEKQQQAQTAEDQRRQKYKDALIDTRSEFFKTCLWGVVWGAVVVLICNQGSSGLTGSDNVLYFGWFFFVPFGWKLLTYLQSLFPVFILGTPFFWLCWFVVKLIICMFIGIPAFIFQLFKTISVEKKIRKLQQPGDKIRKEK